MQVNKRNNTAFKVLYLLKLLVKEPKHLDKLLFDLSSLEDGQVLTKGVILKYINTLRVSGFDIQKEKKNGHYVYKIAESPSKISLNQDDILTLRLLKDHISSYFSSENKEAYEKFLNIVKAYLTPEQVKTLLKEEEKNLASNYKELSESKKKTVNLFSKLTRENQRLELCYRLFGNDSLEKLLIEPKGVCYIKNVIYCAGYSPELNSTRLIPLDSIVRIFPLPSRSKFSQMRQDIVFKLVGRVAKGYTIRRNEKLIEKEDSFVIVSNSYEDKQLLFNRLLRYGAYCEILYPESIRKDFIKTLKEMVVMCT